MNNNNDDPFADVHEHVRAAWETYEIHPLVRYLILKTSLFQQKEVNFLLTMSTKITQGTVKKAKLLDVTVDADMVDTTTRNGFLEFLRNCLCPSSKFTLHIEPENGEAAPLLMEALSSFPHMPPNVELSGDFAPYIGSFLSPKMKVSDLTVTSTQRLPGEQRRISAQESLVLATAFSRTNRLESVGFVNSRFQTECLMRLVDALQPSRGLRRFRLWDFWDYGYAYPQDTLENAVGVLLRNHESLEDLSVPVPGLNLESFIFQTGLSQHRGIRTIDLSFDMNQNNAINEKILKAFMDSPSLQKLHLGNHQINLIRAGSSIHDDGKPTFSMEIVGTGTTQQQHFNTLITAASGAIARVCSLTVQLHNTQSLSHSETAIKQIFLKEECKVSSLDVSKGCNRSRHNPARLDSQELGTLSSALKDYKHLRTVSLNLKDEASAPMLCPKSTIKNLSLCSDPYFVRTKPLQFVMTMLREQIQIEKLSIDAGMLKQDCDTSRELVNQLRGLPLQSLSLMNPRSRTMEVLFKEVLATNPTLTALDLRGMVRDTTLKTVAHNLHHAKFLQSISTCTSKPENLIFGLKYNFTVHQLHVEKEGESTYSSISKPQDYPECPNLGILLRRNFFLLRAQDVIRSGDSMPTELRPHLLAQLGSNRGEATPLFTVLRSMNSHLLPVSGRSLKKRARP